MKLLTKSKELQKEFGRLMKQYDKFFWAIAWASSSSIFFKDLKENKEKIKKIVVGIHFYQTHPDFIKEFVDNMNVHFIQQPEGTFHPKIYLFTNSKKDWELIISSANFTNSAFLKNTEASILLSSEDENPNYNYENAIELIETAWLEGKTFSNEDLKNYRITWKNQQPKIKSLSGLYGNKKRKSKPIYEVPVINRSWAEFMDAIRNEDSHGFERRLKVIKIVKNLFSKKKYFNELTTEERKFIAGIPNKLPVEKDVDWGFFGSMKGAGIFKNRIIENDPHISKALDEIPLSGQITHNHYQKFIDQYKKTFSGNYLATATRLLAMKRPDTFVCLDNKNKSALCKDFGIIQSGLDYERYWNDIIMRIYDSEWWNNPNPKNEKEQKVSEARAAFLDSLYYKE